MQQPCSASRPDVVFLTHGRHYIVRGSETLAVVPSLRKDKWCNLSRAGGIIEALCSQPVKGVISESKSTTLDLADEHRERDQTFLPHFTAATARIG